MPSWKKLIVSGSDASLNSLIVNSGVTGSLQGTASWANNAISSSYAFNATSASYSFSATSASYAATASSADQFNVRNALTASGLRYPTADGIYTGQTLQTNAAGLLSFNNVETIYENIQNGEATTLTKGTATYISGSQGDRPIVYRADASNPAKMPVAFIVAEDIAAGGQGRGVTLGLIRGYNTAYAVGTEVFVDGNGTLTNIRPTGSADIVQPIGVITKTGSGGILNVLNPGPANIPNLQQNYVWVGNSNNFPTAIPTSSIQNVVSASYAGFAQTIASGLNITASSLLVAGNISASSITATSASFGYIQSVTGSAVIVGQEYIILNTQQPAARFAGLQIYDSGSNVTASIVWDSERNHFIYQNTSGSSYTGGGFMSGPRHTGSLGDEPYPTLNRVLRGQGGDHLYDSNIFDDNTAIRLEINTQVTGSLTVTAGITGSLNGTASWANNATTASYILQAVSASFASTASFVPGYVSGSGVSGQVAFWTGTNIQSGSNNLWWDISNSRLGIGTTSPGAKFESINSVSWISGNSLAGSFSNTTVIPNAASIGTVTINSIGSFKQMTYSGNATLANSGRHGSLDVILSLGSTATSTVTHNQASTIRAISGISAGTYYNPDNATTLTISHLAGIRVIPDINSGAGSVNVTNKYGVLIADASGGAGAITYTNRWGIYQEGALDNNYFAGKLLLNTTTTSSFQLDVNGTTRITGNTIITGSLTVVTGSAVELQVTNTGVTLGSAITDTHTVTGSLNISGSTTITGSLSATNFTGSLFGTASWTSNAISASFAPTATNVYIQGGNSFGATALLGTNDVQDLQFETSGSVRMTISGSTGFVGIGTTIPSHALDVIGTGRFTAIIETSTRTLKSNVQPYSTEIDKFKQLEPVSFTWNDTGKQDVGLIAEDVEQIFPEFVSKTEDGNVTGINYGKLATIFINVLKQQQEKIELLEEQIKKLTS